MGREQHTQSLGRGTHLNNRRFQDNGLMMWPICDNNYTGNDKKPKLYEYIV